MNEIIPGEQTAPEVTSAIEALTRRIGYHPVTRRRRSPGFVENRVLYAIMRECLALVDEGVIDIEGLDLNVQWGIGYKLAVVPPIQLLDMAGLDIYTSVAELPEHRPLRREGCLEHRGRAQGKGAVGDQDRRRLFRLHARASDRAATATRRPAGGGAQGAD